MNSKPIIILIIISIINIANAKNLNEIKKDKVLRHIGVPYANFITGYGDGMSVDIIKKFANHLGVQYEFVKSNWSDIISDVTGKKYEVKNGKVNVLGKVEVKGDLIANGLTIISWRKKLINYSTPVFPSQVWLIAKAGSKMKPIKPTGNIKKDIEKVKMMLRNYSVLGKEKTCLDPSLYQLANYTDKIKLFDGPVNEIAPAIINGEAEVAVLDVPDVLVALDKWVGKIKIIGPVSPKQKMAIGFPKGSQTLREEFNRFFKKIKADGTYRKIVKKYYPSIEMYFPEFFKGTSDKK